MTRHFRAALVPATVVVVGMGAAHPAFAQKLLGDGIRELSDQIVASASEQQKHRIAVLALRELSGDQTVLGTYLAESLTTQLFRAKGFDILERTMLDKVLGEMKLASTGLIDPATAARIGKLAGVDAIVTGSITDMQSSVAVNCRLIDVSTARVFGVAESRIVKDDDLRAIMGRPLQPLAQPERRAPAFAAHVSEVVQAFEFEVEDCTRRPQGAARGPVACRIWITNHRDDRNFFIGSGVGVVGVSYYDDQGNQYHGDQIRIGNQQMTPLGVKLIAGLRTLAVFEVEGAVVGKSFSRIEFSVGASDVGFFRVVLKDVPIR